jgi:hypothetical protein
MNISFSMACVWAETRTYVLFTRGADHSVSTFGEPKLSCAICTRQHEKKKYEKNGLTLIELY